MVYVINIFNGIKFRMDFLFGIIVILSFTIVMACFWAIIFAFYKLFEIFNGKSSVVNRDKKLSTMVQQPFLNDKDSTKNTFPNRINSNKIKCETTLDVLKKIKEEKMKNARIFE